MTKAFVYIRFSSKKQEKGDSLERQQTACLNYVTAKGWELAEEPFGDFGVSAWKGDHLNGKLGKFAHRVRSGDVPPGSVLVVEELDRLSRQDPRKTQRWMEDITDLGLRIAVVAGDRIYDQASLSSSIMETFEILMKAKVAHDFVETLSGRVKGSWERRRLAAVETKKVISAHAPGWLRVVENVGQRTFEPIPERVAAVREIYRLAAEGLGARLIAKSLNKQGFAAWGREFHHRKSKKVGWEHSYVGDILRSAAVEGAYEPGTGRKSYKKKTGQRIEGYFGESVVDADLVARARAAMSRRKGTGGRGRAQLHNLFSGAAFCRHCGGKMFMIRAAGKPNAYLACRNANTGRGCENAATFHYGRFEKAALDVILPRALDDRYFERPDQTNALAIQLAETRRAISLRRDAVKNLARSIAAAQDPAILSEVYDETMGDLRALEAQAHKQEEALRIAQGAVSPQEHLRRVLEVKDALTHSDYEIRLSARRKVHEAIHGIDVKVWCEMSRGLRLIRLNLMELEGALSPLATYVFDNDGNLLHEADVVSIIENQIRAATEEEKRAAQQAIRHRGDSFETLETGTREKLGAYLRRRRIAAT